MGEKGTPGEKGDVGVGVPVSRKIEGFILKLFNTDVKISFSFFFHIKFEKFQTTCMFAIDQCN